MRQYIIEIEMADDVLFTFTVKRHGERVLTFNDALLPGLERVSLVIYGNLEEDPL